MYVYHLDGSEKKCQRVSLSLSPHFLSSLHPPFFFFLSTRHMNCLDVYFGWCLGKWFRKLSAMIA